MNLTTWFIFGIITIMLFAIISNMGQTSINNINDQFAKLQCPTPLYSIVDLGNGTFINSNSNSHTGFNYGSDYICFYDPTSNPPSVHETITHINYNATTFNAFPNGWFSYVGDLFASVMFKVGAVVNLISYVLTPINFSILGYTISDISGVALMFVIGVYIFAYIPIGIYIYKSVSPFVSVG